MSLIPLLRFVQLCSALKCQSMASLESALSVFASHRCSTKCFSSPKPLDSIKLHLSNSHFTLSCNSVFSSKLSSINSSRRLCFELLCSALQELAAEENPEETQVKSVKKKLYVFNLPWSLTAVDIKDLFRECGTVKDVQIVKKKDGRRRGFAFVTMASWDEAEAAIKKFNSYEVSRRIIRVEHAKSGPPSQHPPDFPADETRYRIYASNLERKARSTHLREFVAENFKTPVSARVVFDGPNGRSTGYGFVSFVTMDEAEAAISTLSGKELMGRPIILKLSQKTVERAGIEKEEEQGYYRQVEGFSPSNS